MARQALGAASVAADTEGRLFLAEQSHRGRSGDFCETEAEEGGVKKLTLTVMLLALSGCGAITNEGIQAAIASCAQFGGLALVAPVKPIATGLYEATCNDGRVVSGRGGK